MGDKTWFARLGDSFGDKDPWDECIGYHWDKEEAAHEIAQECINGLGVDDYPDFIEIKEEGGESELFKIEVEWLPNVNLYKHP